MLARSELSELTQWCHGNAIRWMPASTECGRPAMMLERCDHRWAWKRLFLILADEGFYLVTEKGETLASASELPAVLDAISGRTAQLPGTAPRRARTRRLAEASASFVV